MATQRTQSWSSSGAQNGWYWSDQIAVVDAATCNAQDGSGCGQTPGMIHVGENTYTIAVGQATNTLYAAVLGPSFKAFACGS